MSDEGFTGIDLAIAYFRGLGRRMMTEGCQRAAERVWDVSAAQLKAGTGPNGQGWKANKDGGLSLRRPITTVVFLGTYGGMRASAEDVMRWHDKTRPTLPKNNTMPSAWSKAADAGLREVAEEGEPK